MKFVLLTSRAKKTHLTKDGAKTVCGEAITKKSFVINRGGTCYECEKCFNAARG